MKFDAVFHATLDKAADAARAAEACGMHGVWSLDTGHNPFMPLLLAAEHTKRVQIGTGVAVALARSPMTLAQEAWDLQAFSGGRFILGLGSQVAAHITKRFSMPWDKPVEQMREMILALRTIWNAFQSGERLKFEGQHYKLSLLTPFFSPGPIAHPKVPIALAGVGPHMTELAGELADGFMMHPFNNRAYYEKVTAPSLERGLAKSGRTRSDLQVIAPVFIITGDEAGQAKLEMKVREQIAFYGSTPAYEGVLQAIGCGDLHKELHALSKQGQWVEMARLIPDDVLAQFSVRAPVHQLATRLLERYAGAYDRIVAHFPMPASAADAVRAVAAELENEGAATA